MELIPNQCATTDANAAHIIAYMGTVHLTPFRRATPTPIAPPQTVTNFPIISTVPSCALNAASMQYMKNTTGSHIQLSSMIFLRLIPSNKKQHKQTADIRAERVNPGIPRKPIAHNTYKKTSEVITNERSLLLFCSISA